MSTHYPSKRQSRPAAAATANQKPTPTSEADSSVAKDQKPVEFEENLRAAIAGEMRANSITRVQKNFCAFAEVSMTDGEAEFLNRVIMRADGCFGLVPFAFLTSLLMSVPEEIIRGLASNQPPAERAEWFELRERYDRFGAEVLRSMKWPI